MRKESYEQKNNKGNVNADFSKSSSPTSQKPNHGNSRKRGKSNKPGQINKNTEGRKTESVYNDPTFYSKYPAVLNQVAKVNNYHPVGLMGKDMFGTTGERITVRPIPGIIAMNVIPAIPVSESGTSTLQQSAYQTWTKIRDAISGSRPYDPVDLQLMSIAVSQAVSCATWLKRFFNFAYTVSPFNRYAPERLFAAMHCNYDDFIANLPKYRAAYDRITINLSRIYANTENYYHQMIRNAFSGVFAEAGDNGQLYLYNPGGYYKYAWNNDSNGVKVGSLEFVGLNPDDRSKPIGEAVILTMDALIHDYEILVNALITDGDINTMSGDILKTYGSKAQVLLPLALETDSDLPRYSAADLSQFQMSYVPINNSEYTDFGIITQTAASHITFTPKLKLLSGALPLYNYDTADEADKDSYAELGAKQLSMVTQRNRVLLNDYIDLNQPSNVAEVVRNVIVFDEYSLVDLKKAISSRTGQTDLTLDIKSTTGIMPYATVIYQIDSHSLVEDVVVMTVKSLFRNFTFMPMRMLWENGIDNTGDGNGAYLSDVHLDANLNDYYSVTPEQVKQIQDVMALSMFSDL